MSQQGIPALPTDDLAEAPETRAPGMAELPDLQDAGGPFTNEDLMTSEELEQLLGEFLKPPKPPAHDDNLVDTLDKNWLDALGQKILEMVDADKRSRASWEQRFKRGLEIIGVKDFVWEKGVAPFEGASNAIAPVIATAIVQSQARFMEEIFPATGPAKTIVMGKETVEKREAADRVQSHMNYQLTVEDEVYYPESEKLALYLAAYGSAYRKGYHDYVADQNVLRFVSSDDLIMPFTARNLKSSPRVTHKFPVEKNEYLLGQKSGAYSENVELSDPGEAPEGEDIVKEELHKVDGVEDARALDDITWTFYETDLNLVVPGEEDEDGVALPYTVTLESVSGKVVALRRNWEEEDELRQRCTRYAEYWYLPGFGVYGTGLIHWIGTLAESSTDALRALLDSATWANLQGGFKAKDSSAVAGELHLRPGAWVDVDMTSDELSKAFHTPPFREPSEALFKLFGKLVEMAEKFASTTDLMVGEQDAKGAPVGTTVALIEQGSKVYSGVHKRAHFSCGIELRMLYRLNGLYISDEGYEYQLPGDDLQVYRQDYNPKITGVQPVSDPNIFSQTQRIALAQARYQLAQENPQNFRKVEVLRSVLKALKDPEIDTVLIDPDNMPDTDPVTENAAMTTGHPARAVEGQNHDAHMAVHMAFLQHPQFGGIPQGQQQIMPAFMAHIAEHLALKQADIYRQLGAPVPPIDLSADPGTPIVPGQDAGAASDMIAQMAAQMIQGFLQASGLQIPPDSGDDRDKELEDDATKATIFNKIATGVGALAKAGASLQENAQGAAEAGNIEAEMDAGKAPAPGTPPAVPGQ